MFLGLSQITEDPIPWKWEQAQPVSAVGEGSTSAAASAPALSTSDDGDPTSGLNPSAGGRQQVEGGRLF